MPGLSCGTWDLVPSPGIEPRPPALGAWSPSHWITREVPQHVNTHKSLWTQSSPTKPTTSLCRVPILLLCFPTGLVGSRVLSQMHGAHSSQRCSVKNHHKTRIQGQPSLSPNLCKASKCLSPPPSTLIFRTQQPPSPPSIHVPSPFKANTYTS